MAYCSDPTGLLEKKTLLSCYTVTDETDIEERSLLNEEMFEVKADTLMVVVVVAVMVVAVMVVVVLLVAILVAATDVTPRLVAVVVVVADETSKGVALLNTAAMPLIDVHSM